MTRNKKLRITEFLIIGVVMGLAEDLIAVTVATGQSINWHIVWVVFLIALPFAFISEIIVDHPRFWEKIFPDRDKK